MDWKLENDFCIEIKIIFLGGGDLCFVVIRQARKDFIIAKYTEKRFAKKQCLDPTSRLHTLCEAVKARDIFSLIQVYAEGVDLMEPIPLANGHVRMRLMVFFFIYTFCKNVNKWFCVFRSKGRRPSI